MQACTTATTTTTAPTLTVAQMSGIFVVIGGFWILSVAMALMGRLMRVYMRRAPLNYSSRESNADVLAMMTDAEMLRKIYEVLLRSDSTPQMPVDSSAKVAPEISTGDVVHVHR